MRNTPLVLALVLRFTGLLFAGSVAAADLDHLRPAARWLADERLRGVLFHHTEIKPAAPLYLAPAVPDAVPTAASVTLRGEHYVLLAPPAGRPIRFGLKTVSGREPFAGGSYALFNTAGEEIAAGLAPPGPAVQPTIAPRGPGPYVLVLNSGPASSTVTELTVMDCPWAIDARAVLPYRDGPMRYHFLRDLQLGGFNLAMVDVESAPQEFLSDAGLRKWTELVCGWGEAARRYRLRILYAVDLGGSEAEVDSWGDAPKGLYAADVHDKIHYRAGAPVAPCPLQKVYWERILLRRGREIARVGRDNPYVVGIGIDPETYMCHVYGHYKPGGTCYCDHCLGGFLRQKGLPEATLKDLATGADRRRWLAAEKLAAAYDAYLEDQTRKMAAWCREELHAVNPDMLFCVYVLEIGNWFCRGLARGLGTPDLPVINFAEETYYGVGYDRPWLEKTMRRFRDLGANFFEGSAVWDLYFPPTRPGYLAAHAYNLGLRAEGWWYWPGDRLYDDWHTLYAYDGQPARKADSWHASVWANREIALSLQHAGRASPLDAAEPVPWKGKYRELEDGWAAGCGVVPCKEPETRVHLAAPAQLFFAVPKRTATMEVTAFAPGRDNGAELELLDPAGKPAGRAACVPDQEVTVRAAASPGVWTLEVKPRAGTSLRDVGLALKPALLVATSKQSLLAGAVKQPGLVAWWPMDEGQGSLVADASQKVAYPGTLRHGRWTTGVKGSALAFAGRGDGVSVAGAESLHGLSEFTLSAWVRLDALPKPHDGATLINKGPEAPVQHVWWWIGYPPSYELALELGNQKHPYGHTLGSAALKWETGRWYHVAVVFRSDGAKSTATHYRDGRAVGTQTANEPFHSGTHDLLLGTYGHAHTLHGALDEVKIWDRPLPADEIAREARRL